LHLVWECLILLSVAVQHEGKLNWLQRNLPEGLVVDAAWLAGHGYSRPLLSHYTKNGWLYQPARGVYRRACARLPMPPNTTKGQGLLWQHVVISLQMLLDKPAAVGGRTALELQGLGHFLSSGSREVHLYSNDELPGWVARVPVDTRFVFHRSTKLFKNGAIPPNLGKPSHNIPGDVRSGLLLQPWGQWDWPLILSTPERAVLELLDELPQQETFHQADVLMEGLPNLSPRRLHALLTDCRSVKVKRLFLWFAERHHHAWLKKLDRTAIDLGRGKRMLVRGGKLDTKFNITVPETLDARV
jgi:hypothetical protein